MNLDLKIEQQDKVFWGDVLFEDNLIIADARSVEKLELKIKKILLDFHSITEVTFTRIDI